MKITLQFMLIIAAFMLSACSDTPGEAKLENMLQQQFDSKYQGLVEIEQLTKLNGWSEHKDNYMAEVSYTIAFKKSFKSFMDEQTAKPGNPLEKMATGIAAGMLKLQYGDFKAGDEYQVEQQTITLRMTENGWAIAD